MSVKIKNLQELVYQYDIVRKKNLHSLYLKFCMNYHKPI